VSRMVELYAAVALAGAIISWQLFVPPIVGLADQGDFVRILGPLGYAPVPRGPEHKYSYVTRSYVWDPSYREPLWEQITSEFVPAAIAVGLNRIWKGPGEFDVTIFGLTHALFFIVALARLLYVVMPLARYRIAWAATLLVLTDVGYVAYWNSLYTEPASCIWFLFLLAESITFCTSERVTVGSAARWNIFAVLWIMAKTQNALLCVPLGLYGLRIAWRAADPKTRYTALAGVAAMLVAGTVMYRSLLPAPRLVGIYNMIFMAVLPESQDPASDLKAFGLDSGYVRYAGTLAWSPDSGLADGHVVNALQANATPITVVEFYLRRPARMWRHMRAVLSVALSLRPEFCGNFDSSAGRPPGARSNSFALWSYFHERYLSPIATYLFGAIALAPFAGAILLWKHSLTPAARRWTEMGMCLSVCASIAFLVATFGDAWDTVKHQFIFNLILDTCLVSGFVAVCDLVPRVIQDRFLSDRRVANPPLGAC
jgi:hypothetical protein